MTPIERAANFAATFPNYVKRGAGFQSSLNGDAIYATWFGGADYKAKGGKDPMTGEPYYGQYPAGYLERVFSMFPDAKRILHLFSGALTADRVDEAWDSSVLKNDPGKLVDSKDGHRSRVWPMPRQIRFDRRSEMYPDVLGDAEQLAAVLCKPECLNLDAPTQRCPVHNDAAKFDLILADPPYSEEDAEHYGTCLVNKKKVVQECAKVLAPGGTLAWMDQAWPWVIGDYGLKLYGTISWYRSMNHRVRGIFLFRKEKS